MQAGNVTGVNGGPVLGDPRFPPSYRLVGEAADAAADIADADLAYATQHLTTYREPRGAAPPPAVVDPWAQYRHRPQPWSYTQVYGRPGAAASSSSNYYAAPAPPPAVHPTYVRTDRPGGTLRGVGGVGSSSPQRVRPYGGPDLRGADVRASGPGADLPVRPGIQRVHAHGPRGTAPSSPERKSACAMNGVANQPAQHHCAYPRILLQPYWSEDVYNAQYAAVQPTPVQQHLYGGYYTAGAQQLHVVQPTAQAAYPRQGYVHPTPLPYQQQQQQQPQQQQQQPGPQPEGDASDHRQRVRAMARPLMHWWLPGWWLPG